MQGCVCPHPPLLIPEIGGDSLDAVAATVRGMEALAADVGEPETVVVVSPHTPGYADAHLVKVAPRLRGDFGNFGCPEAAFAFDNDTAFVDLLLALAGGDKDVTLVPGEGDLLDHGVLVPLSFLRPARIVSLSIVNAYSEHRALGQLVRRCAEELGRDTLFVASGDLSHRLIPSAPAGFDPRGQTFDELLLRAFEAGDFAALSHLDRGIVGGAGECGLRSFIALGGFLGDEARVDPHVYSYEGPFGVGYLVARFGRREARPHA
jgi:aromatic ring-opening dioxygenase LigB subunit